MGNPTALLQQQQTEQPLKRYVFLLLDTFSSLGFNCAIEALNAANGYKGQSYYSWLVISRDGLSVAGSNGLSVNVDGALRPLNRKDTIVVCGGADIASTSTLDVLNWLRRETRKGVSCGAIGTAAHTLAMAGLLGDKSVTTHWQHHSAFAETFPDLCLNNSIFSIDHDRFTCAGGASSMDLMLHLIANDYGQALANRVADQLVYTSPRTKEHTQRLSIHCHTGVRNEKFSQAIALMLSNTEDPLAHSVLAKEVGISTRQLERLFRKYLNTSPKVYYMELRLEKARNLLLQTNMSITEICVACGFNSTSHFSKCYRRRFGMSPSFENASSPKVTVSTQ
jgi:transcriptional regulator GlxA family with amidase domain